MELLIMWDFNFQLKVNLFVKPKDAEVSMRSKGTGCSTEKGPYVAFRTGGCLALYIKNESTLDCKLEFLMISWLASLRKKKISALEMWGLAGRYVGRFENLWMLSMIPPRLSTTAGQREKETERQLKCLLSTALGLWQKQCITGDQYCWPQSQNNLTQVPWNNSFGSKLRLETSHCISCTAPLPPSLIQYLPESH